MESLKIECSLAIKVEWRHVYETEEEKTKNVDVEGFGFKFVNIEFEFSTFRHAILTCSPS